MSMMLKSVNPEAAAAIGTITKVGVGNMVVYHGRQGYVRQQRSSFPALVMRQYEDDGSLDLLVFMEPEDVIMESRIQFRSHNQPHHCWSAVQDVPGAAPLMVVVPEGFDMAEAENAGPGAITYLRDPDDSNSLLSEIRDSLAALAARFEPLLKRVTVLEMKRPPGRPPNTPKPETEAT